MILRVALLLLAGLIATGCSTTRYPTADERERKDAFTAIKQLYERPRVRQRARTRPCRPGL